jgi:lysophospholipase L1-like esterase
MPLGASSTVGTGSASTAGYRGPLQQRMAAHWTAVDLVGSQQDGPASVPDRDHEGHGGWTLARMAPQVAAWVREARPDVVLLHAGTNDLIEGASAQVAAQRLDVVLDAIHQASDAHVIVAGVWAPLPARAQARAEFDALAAAVVAEHRAEGRSVSYADTSELLTRTELADGLHPNAAGYQRIAAMWEEQIRAAVAEA